MSFLERLQSYRKLLLQETEPKQYRIINSFAGTTMEAREMANPMFRPFETVKESVHRNTNVSPGFDMHTDSLMDYPTIIKHKLNAEEWEPYNKLTSVHVPFCPFNCWHCYDDKKLCFSREEEQVKRLPFVTAEYIVNEFLSQHKQDWEKRQESKRNESNVLRITGGEPFLVPELIEDCLNQLETKKEGFRRAPFLWTETDLWPFISEGGKYFKELREVLSQLAKFRNLAIHPCLHGITDDSVASTTGEKDLKLGQLLEGIQLLLDNKLDIYPTFGSNVNPPEVIQDVFKELYKMNKYLPLRFALVRYDLRYPEVEERLRQETSRNPKLSSSYTSLRIWNTLLMKHYEVGYGVIPRHLVSLYDSHNIIISALNFIPDEEYKPKYEPQSSDLIYLFKTSYRDDYHRELLDILALPKGHIYKLEYDAEWIQDDLWQHMKMRPSQYLDRPAVLIYADDRSRYEKFIPLRKIKIKKVEVQRSVVVFYLELGDFLYPPQVKPDKVKTFRQGLEVLFGKSTLPGARLNKLILIGEIVSVVRELQCGSDVSDWRETIDFLHEEQCQAFKDSLFFYIRKEEMEGLNQLPANEIETAYSCNAGQRFSFKVYYYLPNYAALGTDPERRTIHFETSSEVIKALVPNDLVLSKYGSGHLSFSPQLLLRGPEKCTIFFKAAKEPFKSPAPELTVEVKDVKGKATQTFALGTAFAGFAGGALASIANVATDLLRWHMGFILAGIFALFYFGGWLIAKYRTL